MSLRQCKIIITGATGKMGEAIVLSLANSNVRFFLHYNSNEKKALSLKKRAEKLGACVYLHKADFTRSNTTKIFIDNAIKKLAGIDILIHTASIFKKTLFMKTAVEDWDGIFDTNLKAPFFLAQKAAASMKKKGGRMIFFSDVAATRIYKEYLPYSISKAALNVMVKGLSKILPSNIFICAVSPYIVTNTSHVAALVKFIISSKKIKSGSIFEITGE